jgi:hypothetical protein
MNRSEHNLRRVLKTNALFSLCSGLILSMARKPISIWMNASYDSILLFVGIGLVLFAGFLLHTATRREMKPKVVQSIIIQDWAWVFGSLLILIIRPFGLSLEGLMAISGVALIVAAFALLQMKNLRAILT